MHEKYIKQRKWKPFEYYWSTSLELFVDGHCLETGQWKDGNVLWKWAQRSSTFTCNEIAWKDSIIVFLVFSAS